MLMQRSCTGRKLLAHPKAHGRLGVARFGHQEVFEDLAVLPAGELGLTSRAKDRVIPALQSRIHANDPKFGFAVGANEGFGSAWHMTNMARIVDPCHRVSITCSTIFR